jgi:hypothetical protein
MREVTNLLGAVLTLAIYALCILVFVFRLVGKVQWGHWVGYVLLLTALPLAYLLSTARQLDRPTLYYVQIALMLAYLVVTLLLDYVLKIDFRQTRWMVISYVTLFFAAAGGMLGVAAHAGRIWTVSAIILFLIMAVLAFVQRAITGM